MISQTTVETPRPAVVRTRPQPGAQTDFLASAADIAIYGGAAGGGKSWALLLEAIRHSGNPEYGGVIFRRTTVQIRNEGGLWDESVKLYIKLGGRPREAFLKWRFPSGADVSFAHLEHENSVYNWQGSQLPFIGFDELTHFSAEQFWYMLSRNRSMCGVRPYVRATCNPDVESWVSDFISWWIDQNTGYPIPERAAVLRWFVRVGQEIVWADDPAELAGYVNSIDGKPIPPKSATFIPATLADNQELMRADPGYVANLMALSTVQRERLLAGNWKIRWADASFFGLESLLEQGRPVPFPRHCDAVFAVIDSASKTEKQHDSTSVTYYARSKHVGYPLIILDWSVAQIEGATLIDWLPSVFENLETLARLCNARSGSVGCWIEDKDSGVILLQQAKAKQMRAHPVSSKLTALGKDQRALAASPYVVQGKIKVAEHAYNKTMTLKGVTKNHLLDQVTNFRPADPNAATRADDCLDTFTGGILVGLGPEFGGA